MSLSDEPSSASLSATEPVRLFPLPNLVMFPHVVQPLHIFEPRYCAMLEDALAGDRQIAMVLLEPGYSRDYDGRPPIAPMACVGKIAGHERLPAGRHNILLRGVCRAAIRRELPAKRLFRQAHVDLMHDFYPSSGTSRRKKLKRELIELARQLLPDTAGLYEQLDELRSSDMSLGMLSDIFAFTLGFSPAVKQRLLAEWNVDRRVAMLRERLTELSRQLAPHQPSDEELPPRFSLN